MISHIIIAKGSLAEEDEDTTDNQSVTTNSFESVSYIFDTASNRMNFNNVIKMFVFPKIKFINTHAEVDYSNKETSVCGLVKKHLNMPSTEQNKLIWWKQLRVHVPMYLNRKRSTVSKAIEKRFESKSNQIGASFEINTHLPLHQQLTWKSTEALTWHSLLDVATSRNPSYCCFSIISHQL